MTRRWSVREKGRGRVAMADMPLGEHLFEQRTDGVEPCVEVGLWVKVGRRSECLWCRVWSVRADGAFVARVDNDLLRNPYRCGDKLVLRACHVIERVDLRDRMSFRSFAAVMGPVSGAVAWLETREGAAAHTLRKWKNALRRDTCDRACNG